MKINMKKLAAWMLALLLVFQLIPAMAFAVEAKITIVSNTVEFDEDDYRDKLKITSDTSIVQVGSEIQMQAPADYNLKWESSKPEIASVDENGVVTGHAEGRVKITAKEEGQDGTYQDSLILKVIGTEETTPEVVTAIEDNDNSENEPVATTTEKAKVIVITINKKDKETYNGQPHVIGYTAEGNFEGFDQNKVHITDGELLLTGKDCGTYQTKFEESSENYFNYDGETEGYEFIVSDGWMKVVPAEVTVKADDVIRLGNTNPAYTATVTGVLEGEDISQIKFNYTTSNQNGVTYIIPDGEFVQGNYKVNYETGILNSGITNTLYNLAEVTNNPGKWYRLEKTQITTAKNLSDYIVGLNKGNVKEVTSDEYYADEYDFENKILVYNKKHYAYITSYSDDMNVDGYYTAIVHPKEFHVVAVKQKIGGTTGYLIDNLNFTEKNETDSFHRNFQITFVDKKEEDLETQDLYNFLNVNGKYYRLQKTKISAKPLEDIVKNKAFGKVTSFVKCEPQDYDFSNIVLNINDKKYVYRDSSYEASRPEKYESYYTVKFTDIDVPDSHKLNKDAAWYKNPDGWLDGEPWGVSNDIDAYHRNYTATLHEGNIQYYTINFQGTDEAIESISEAEGTTVELPMLEKDGFNFRGWSLVENPAEDTELITSLTLNGNVTLYPIWGEAIDESNLSVILHSNVEGMPEVEAGTEVVLTAEPVGFTGIKYTIEWEYEKPDGTRVKIEGADSLNYKFKIDSENAQYVYHVILTPTGMEE